jgi:uroporphyrinogen-III synthase
MDFEEKALHGKNILVTRPQEQAFEFASMLINEGANIYLLPTIKIIAANDFTHIDSSLSNIGNYVWIIFSSVNGAKFFLERLKFLNIDIATLQGCKIAAIGPSTAKLLESSGLNIDFIPKHHTSTALAKEMDNIAGVSVLAPVTDISTNSLREILEAKGARLDEIVYYYTRKNEVALEYIKKTFKSDIHIVTFTSSSAVTSLIDLTEPLHIDLNEYCIACIGPGTAETAKEHGLDVSIIGNPYTLDGLLNEIKAFYMVKESSPPVSHR